MELLAKNLLIRKQATEAVRALESCGVDAILLKGVALMEISPEYSFEREVEDIDILIKPGYLGRAVSALESAGYVRVPSDPFAFVSPDYPVPVDISEGLWYLSNEENKKVFDNSLRAGDFRILSPADFLTHLYCHSQLHHARNEKKWLRDIEVLKTVFYSNASETFLLHLSTLLPFYPSTSFLSFLISNEIPQKGHITRFLFLPLRKKIIYLCNLFLPSEAFITGRYNVAGSFGITFYRILRPFLLIRETIRSFAAKSKVKISGDEMSFNRKLFLGTLVSIFLILSGCSVSAWGSFVYDAEALASGGAYTAAAHKATSILWNPAALFLENKRSGFDFQITGGGGVNFTGNILESANNVTDLASKFSAINTAQKSGASVDISQISTLSVAMKNVKDIGSGVKGMLASGGGGMFLRIGKIAFSVNNYFVSGLKPYADISGFWLGSGTVTTSALGVIKSAVTDNYSGIVISTTGTNTQTPSDVATRDLLIEQIAWLKADLVSAGVSVPAVDDTVLANVLINNALNNNISSADIASAVNTIAENKDVIRAVLQGANPSNVFSANQSNITLKGVNVSELAVGSAWQLPVDDLYLGVNLKLLSAVAGFYRQNVFQQETQVTQTKVEDSFNKLSKNTKQSLQPGLDIGLLYDKTDTKWKSRVALMAKNINRPKFDMPDEAKKYGENEIYLDPQVRLGVAYFPFKNLFFISSDVEVTKERTFIPGYESQMWALGLEYNLIGKKWLNLALRAGFMKNIAREENIIYSGGLGLNLFHLVIDLSGALDTSPVKINSRDSIYSNGTAAASISLYF